MDRRTFFLLVFSSTRVSPRAFRSRRRGIVPRAAGQTTSSFRPRRHLRPLAPRCPALMPPRAGRSAAVKKTFLKSYQSDQSDSWLAKIATCLKMDLYVEFRGCLLLILVAASSLSLSLSLLYIHLGIPRLFCRSTRSTHTSTRYSELAGKGRR